MAVKFLDNTGLGYFWGKIKAWCSSTFAAIAHTHTSYAVKHSYTTAANAAKNWYRIANANTSQLDTTKPIRAQFIVTAYNTSYAADYYETWFVNCIVFGRQAHIVIFGGSGVPFSQARILYENTVANIDANDRPAIDLYLNYVLPNGTTKIEVEEIYNNGGWTFVADGQLAASTVPSGFENVASAPRNSGVNSSTYADYVNYLNRQISNITAAFTLADSYLYRSRTLNCTGTFTITVPSINSGYMWCVIKNKNTSSGVITLHPSTTSVLIDGSNADITLQPMEYVCIHSAGANNYSLIADGRWKSQKADKATTLAGYGITDAKIVNGTITLGSNSITPLTSVPSHNQASNTINAMTGYSKPNSSSAIAASDSLNSAIGKLEAKVDAVDQSNVVHRTGDELITGVKVFHTNESDFQGNNTVSRIVIKNDNITKGTFPDHSVWHQLLFTDNSNNSYEATGNVVTNRLGMLQNKIGSDYNQIEITAYKNSAEIADQGVEATILVGFDANGEKVAKAPETSTTRVNREDIVTRGFLEDKGYTTATGHTHNYLPLGGGTLTGDLYGTNIVFNSVLAKKHASVTKGTAPSSGTYYWTINFADKNGVDYTNNTLAQLESRISTDNKVYFYMRALKNTAATTTNAEMGVIYDTNNNTGWAYCPHPAANANDTSIATTKWVKDRGYLTSHASLSLTTSGSGNAITALSVSNHAITATKGATFLTSHQSLANYVTLSGEQQITGYKKFIKDMSLVNSNYTAGSNISSDQWWSLIARDTNSYSMGGMWVGVFSSDKHVSTELRAYESDKGGTYCWVAAQNKTDATRSVVVGCGAFYPNSSGTTLGKNNNTNRWGQIYSSSTTIQTSDERVKTSIDVIPDEVLDAWENFKFKQFQMKDAVEKKGENARLHTGGIAQEIDRIFKEANLDARRYGMFCWDEWEAEPAEFDESGYERTAAIDAGEIYSLRYEELLCMEAAYQRRKNKILENRISELEKQVSDMLQILQSLKGAN